MRMTRIPHSSARPAAWPAKSVVALGGLLLAVLVSARASWAQAPLLSLPNNSAGTTESSRQSGPQGLLAGRPMAPAVSAEILQARELLTRQRWSEASALIEAQLAKRPRDPQWRFLQAVLLAEMGKRTEAISAFERITEDFPELAEPYNNLAALYVDQNDLHRARLLLERAIQNRPDYALAHENLGDVYTRLAMQAYEKASRAKQPAASVVPKLNHLQQTPALRQTRILTTR